MVVPAELRRVIHAEKEVPHTETDARAATHDCVNNATVRELKGGDSRTDQAKVETTRTPGWHLEETAGAIGCCRLS